MEKQTEEIISLIEKKMIEKGLNPYQLSKLAGVNDTSVTRLFKKELNPRLDLIIKLCNVLGVENIEIKR